MRPPSSAPSVTSWPTIRGSDSSPILVLSPTSIPKPSRKPWSRWTSTETPSGLRSSMAIFACLPSLSNVALGPLADRQPGRVVVGRERRVGGVGGLGLRVERDHQQAGLARLVERGHDRLGVVRRDHQALRAGRDQALDRRDLRLVVAVLLAREGLQLGARASAPPRVAPSFIFTKNGFVSVLVIRPTLTSSPPPLAAARRAAALLSSPPHAATPADQRERRPGSRDVRPVDRMPSSLLHLSRLRAPRPETTFSGRSSSAHRARLVKQSQKTISRWTIPAQTR